MLPRVIASLRRLSHPCLRASPARCHPRIATWRRPFMRPDPQLAAGRAQGSAISKFRRPTQVGQIYEAGRRTDHQTRRSLFEVSGLRPLAPVIPHVLAVFRPSKWIHVKQRCCPSSPALLHLPYLTCPTSPALPHMPYLTCLASCPALDHRGRRACPSASAGPTAPEIGHRGIPRSNCPFRSHLPPLPMVAPYPRSNAAATT